MYPLLLTSPVIPEVTGEGVTIITSLTSKRWGLNKNFDLVDLVSNITYLRDTSIDLSEGSFSEIPDLSTDAVNHLSVSYLLALTYFPVPLTESQLIDIGNGLTFDLLYGEYEGRPNQHFWKVADGGVKFLDNLNYAYVPGATNYIVNENGLVHSIESGEGVTAGTGRDGIVVITGDNGTTGEIEMARLVLLAYGKYTLETWQNEITYLDGDSENRELSNLSLIATAVEGKHIATVTSRRA